MPRKYALATITVVAAGTLAACSSSGPSAPPVTVTATVTQTVQAQLKPTPTAEVTPTAAPTSARGNVEKKAGEWGWVSGSNGDNLGDAAFQIRVTKIKVDPTCDGQFATKSKAGHLVALTVEARTSKELVKALSLTGGTALGIGPATWSLIGSDGYNQSNPATAAAFACADDSEVIPTSIGPAQKAKGLVVLDSKTKHGVVVYSLNGQGDTGWEWKF
ncbi:hypothetical protein GCM10025864_44700 [Luteimicrobium album]|uniref:Uncharacterized protein n=1 Tax=Luteimicrobium album TaxID=1054550 RepID=A0ABQ6I7J9_9MICO|nr:hypothetical protein [Luteimicrobium album]GMA22244.1 hypothetical protein GCM10025864_00030 [Luteimicrobium album]GMA26649.1 hypothetical protein GCM10025864_44080 [Luteimicrobium album]GMA26711.1 hypothetical protein GCM10025864_44700 [Luteimicrobium album]